MKNLLSLVACVALLAACGPAQSGQGEKTASGEVNEEAYVDSLATAYDEVQTSLEMETEQTISEIDSLLNGI